MSSSLCASLVSSLRNQFAYKPVEVRCIRVIITYGEPAQNVSSLSCSSSCSIPPYAHGSKTEMPIGELPTNFVCWLTMAQQLSGPRPETRLLITAIIQKVFLFILYGFVAKVVILPNTKGKNCFEIYLEATFQYLCY